MNSAIARGLRQRGVGVTTTAEADLQDPPDEAHLAYALQAGRVIFTQDDDFARMNAAGVAHAGIVYAKKGTRTIGEVVEFLELLSQCADAEEMKGRVEYC